MKHTTLLMFLISIQTGSGQQVNDPKLQELVPTFLSRRFTCLAGNFYGMAIWHFQRHLRERANNRLNKLNNLAFELTKMELCYLKNTYGFPF